MHVAQDGCCNFSAGVQPLGAGVQDDFEHHARMVRQVAEGGTKRVLDHGARQTVAESVDHATPVVFGNEIVQGGRQKGRLVCSTGAMKIS